MAGRTLKLDHPNRRRPYRLCGYDMQTEQVERSCVCEGLTGGTGGRVSEEFAPRSPLVSLTAPR